MRSIPQHEITAALKNIRHHVATPLQNHKERAPADLLDFQLKHACRQPYIREHKICADRRFMADFFFPNSRLVVELDGGGWVNGRHSRGQGMENDCEKSALIAAMPARLIRVTPRQVKTGRALEWILTAIKPI